MKSCIFFVGCFHNFILNFNFRIGQGPKVHPDQGRFPQRCLASQELPQTPTQTLNYYIVKGAGTKPAPHIVETRPWSCSQLVAYPLGMTSLLKCSLLLREHFYICLLLTVYAK